MLLLFALFGFLHLATSSPVCYYEKMSEYALLGTYKHIKHVSLDECKDECNQEGETCRSFNYNYVTDSCFLNEETRETNPDQFYAHDLDYFQKVCGVEVPLDYEVHTEPPCDGIGFQCANGDCLPQKSWQCDGDYDCTDGTDETTCVTPAPEAFTCPNGHLINASWLCDGDYDCEDHADEENCAALSCRSFQCPNGDCINESWRCDGENDCGDMADEKDCPKK